MTFPAHFPLQVATSHAILWKRNCNSMVAQLFLVHLRVELDPSVGKLQEIPIGLQEQIFDSNGGSAVEGGGSLSPIGNLQSEAC